MTLEVGRSRPFATVDAMTLLAALAVALGIYRGVRSGEAIGLTPILHGDGMESTVALICLLLPTSIALLLLELRRHRSRRMTERPGFLATAIASLFALLLAPKTCWQAATRNPAGFDLPTALWFALWPLADGVGLCVAGAWATSALLGRWRPEATWLDRSGLLLGSVWVALATSRLVGDYP